MSEPQKPSYTWQTVTIDHESRRSNPIDVSLGALVQVITPDRSEVAIFAIEVQNGAAWYALAGADGMPMEWSIMRNRAISIDAGHTKPYSAVRLSMAGASSVPDDYPFLVCVETI